MLKPLFETLFRNKFECYFTNPNIMSAVGLIKALNVGTRRACKKVNNVTGVCCISFAEITVFGPILMGAILARLL